MKSPLALLLLLACPFAAQQRVELVATDDPGITVTRIHLPELDLVVRDVRRALPDGRIERSGLDATGAPVDVDALRRADHALALERHGRIHPTLRERLAGLAPGDELDVALWLREPDDGFDPGAWIRERTDGLPREVVAETVRALRAEALARNEERLAPRVAAVAEAVRAEGGEVVVAGLGWPLVGARVTAAAAPRLAAHGLVDMAYVAQPVWAPEGEFAQGTMRTFEVHDQGVLADGSVRVMVNDPGGVQTTNPYLPPVVQLVPDSASSHATGVAGNIANLHPVHFAAAFTLQEIYSGAGSGDFAAPGVWNTAIAAGIDFGNCSWWNFLKGKIEFLDRFFDYTVRNFSVMMFKSNGNQGSTSTPYATTPGNGYNVTCSGNYSDADDVHWANDAMASSSSYWNPIEGHEKPEVASPGSCVTTTGTGGGGLQGCFGGTSSASPLTCGVAALVASSDPTLLAQMTTVKAVLMVSAWHDVDPGEPISDRDGAGGVHAKAAHSVVRDGQWWHEQVTAPDLAGGFLDVTVPLVAGEKTRVIALWQSKADSSFSTDVLEMDLDMTVLDPGGNPVATSASAANPFELVSFLPPETGDYTVRLQKQRFDGVREPLTVAWSTQNDAGTGWIELDAAGEPLAAGASPTFLLRERYEGAGADYFAWASLDPAPAMPLSGGWVLPIGFDPVSEHVLTLPGWMGTLSPLGEAQTVLPLPPAPELAGIELHFGLAVFRGGVGPTGPVTTVSDPLSLTIGP